MLQAITRVDVAEYLQTFITVYTVLIFVRILMSWIPQIPDNDILRAIVRFVHDVTEPYLGIFRRFLPPLGVGGMGLDLSPIVALIVLQVVGAIVVNLVAG